LECKLEGGKTKLRILRYDVRDDRFNIGIGMDREKREDNR
jgi:hypothetical protein